MCVCVLCVCVCGGGGGGEGGVGGGKERWEGDKRGDSLISNSVCVRVGVERTGKVIHLFQAALKNLANKYFHFGQFLILSSVV